jgi:D-alanyl-D-alanine carboxypeptidase
LREAYGRKISNDTRFCIGSMGKMFTAVAIMQLIQNRRLQLNDTIATLLPAYPNAGFAREVTIEHLLTHSGGTGDFFGPDYEKHQAELRTLADFVRLFGNREPAFAPGSRWGYSNFGFILLGAILERVSDMPWDMYLQTHIFRVADMTSTSPLASEGNTAQRALEPPKPGSSGLRSTSACLPEADTRRLAIFISLPPRYARAACSTRATSIC